MNKKTKQEKKDDLCRRIGVICKDHLKNPIYKGPEWEELTAMARQEQENIEAGTDPEFLPPT